MIRPAPDCRATVTALLPVVQSVAVYASLKQAADTAYSDTRSHKQVMADTFVERTTGQTEAHLVPVQINLTMTADTLLSNGATPAWLEDLGPVSAEHARAIAAGDPATAPGEQPGTERQRAKAWIRRILTDPITGIATNLDSRRRTFDGNARTFLTLRDRTCRQPFCSAPIRHVDHIRPARKQGPTSIDNGQGLCERGNYVKDMPGWTTRKGNRPGEVITTTPTGHTYRTMPPPQVGLPNLTVPAD